MISRMKSRDDLTIYERRQVEKAGYEFACAMESLMMAYCAELKWRMRNGGEITEGDLMPFEKVGAAYKAAGIDWDRKV